MTSPRCYLTTTTMVDRSSSKTTCLTKLTSPMAASKVCKKRIWQLTAIKKTRKMPEVNLSSPITINFRVQKASWIRTKIASNSVLRVPKPYLSEVKKSNERGTSRLKTIKEWSETTTSSTVKPLTSGRSWLTLAT